MSGNYCEIGLNITSDSQRRAGQVGSRAHWAFDRAGSTPAPLARTHFHARCPSTSPRSKSASARFAAISGACSAPYSFTRMLAVRPGDGELPAFLQTVRHRDLLRGCGDCRSRRSRPQRLRDQGNLCRGSAPFPRKFLRGGVPAISNDNTGQVPRSSRTVAVHCCRGLCFQRYDAGTDNATAMACDDVAQCYRPS
jgi:hypothetical protein